MKTGKGNQPSERILNELFWQRQMGRKLATEELAKAFDQYFADYDKRYGLDKDKKKADNDKEG